ncbi:MAG: serine/threonine protein kinase [Phycisphaerales bacterium]|nr:serine/threonine protein kinase [Phycisphaerales bacterium]
MPDDPLISGPENPSARSVRLAWASGQGAEAVGRALTPQILADEAALAELLAADAEERWDRGEPATVETYAALVPELKTRPEACRSLLMCELARREDRADPAVASRLKHRLPELADEIDLVVGFFQVFGSQVEGAPGGPAPAAAAGDHLGSYELRERLGRGSFGEVWRAWDSSLQRQVALKLLPEPSEGEAEELLAEARAAAGLDHDHIVRVHSAGRFADAGLLYIDAQLVGDAAPTAEDPAAVRVGRSLEETAVGAGGLAPREAARVMEAVCRAVSAAHARGVTHGDIKPGNILLTPRGRPMVADFGLAVLSPPGVQSDSPAHTVSINAEGKRITGTPAFMSPEQARGERPTPLSDIYSLGATLAAVLSGRAPFSPRPGSTRAALDVIEQVRESPPALEDVARIDRTLAAICRHAAAHDPAERYLSATAMADDLGAWIANRPTTVHPLPPLARGTLWFRRNPLAATIGLAAVVAVALGGWRHVLVVEAERDRAIEAESAARDAFAVSVAVNDYMRSVIGAADPRSLGTEATVGEALDDALERVTADLAGQPRVEAGVRAMIGATYTSLGRHDEAEEQLARAYALHVEHFGPYAPQTLTVLHDLATLRQDQGNLEEGERLLRQVIEGRTAALGPDHETTLRTQADLARLDRNLERFDEAEALLIHAVARLESLYGSDNPNTLIARKDLASIYTLTGRHTDAVEPLRSVLAAQERTLGPQHPDTLVTVSDLASVLRRGDEAERAEAIELYKRALDGFRTRQPVGHLDRVIVLFNIANALRLSGRFDEARGYAREAVQEGEIGLGPDHYVTLMNRALEAGLLARLGHPEEGRAALLAIRARFVELFGEEHSYVTFVDGQLEAIDNATDPGGG